MKTDETVLVTRAKLTGTVHWNGKEAVYGKPEL